MKTSKFSEEQIAYALRHALQSDDCVPVVIAAVTPARKKARTIIQRARTSRRGAICARDGGFRSYAFLDRTQPEVAFRPDVSCASALEFEDLRSLVRGP